MSTELTAHAAPIVLRATGRLTTNERRAMGQVLASAVLPESDQDRAISQIAEDMRSDRASTLLLELAAECSDLALRERLMRAWLRLQPHAETALVSVATSFEWPEPTIALIALRLLTARGADPNIVAALERVATTSPEPVALEAARALPREAAHEGLYRRIIESSRSRAVTETVAGHLEATVSRRAALDALLRPIGAHQPGLDAACLAIGAYLEPPVGDDVLADLWRSLLLLWEESAPWETTQALAEALRTLRKPTGSTRTIGRKEYVPAEAKARALVKTLTSERGFLIQNQAPSWVQGVINASPGAEQLGVAEALAENLADRTEDRRLVEATAFVLRAVAGGLDTAGNLIDQVGRSRSMSIPDSQLKPLRIEVGGEVALSPFLEERARAQKEDFEEPVRGVLNETQRQWQKTMSSATFAFRAKVWMSIALFVVGLAIIAVGAWRYLAGDSNLWGPGVSLAAGLGAMAGVTYGTPLKQIREATRELGSSNAAFISFVHRIQQVSFTFTHEYTAGKVGTAELEAFGSMLTDAARQVVDILDRSANAEDGEPGPAAPDAQ